MRIAIFGRLIAIGVSVSSLCLGSLVVASAAAPSPGPITVCGGVLCVEVLGTDVQVEPEVRFEGYFHLTGPLGLSRKSPTGVWAAHQPYTFTGLPTAPGSYCVSAVTSRAMLGSPLCWEEPRATASNP